MFLWRWKGKRDLRFKHEAPRSSYGCLPPREWSCSFVKSADSADCLVKRARCVVIFDHRILMQSTKMTMDLEIGTDEAKMRQNGVAPTQKRKDRSLRAHRSVYRAFMSVKIEPQKSHDRHWRGRAALRRPTFLKRCKLRFAALKPVPCFCWEPIGDESQ